MACSASFSDYSEDGGSQRTPDVRLATCCGVAPHQLKLGFCPELWGPGLRAQDLLTPEVKWNCVLARGPRGFKNPSRLPKLAMLLQALGFRIKVSTQASEEPLGDLRIFGVSWFGRG